MLLLDRFPLQTQISNWRAAASHSSWDSKADIPRMLAAVFAAAGTPEYKHQRASQVAEGTGLVRVETFRLHCIRIVRRGWRQRNRFDPLPHQIFPTHFKRNRRPGLTRSIISWGRRETFVTKGIDLSTEWAHHWNLQKVLHLVFQCLSYLLTVDSLHSSKISVSGGGNATGILWMKNSIKIDI